MGVGTSSHVAPVLRAGAANVDTSPPLGVDMVGYLRRWAPAQGYGEPLEAQVIVVDDGAQRVVVTAVDLLGTPGEYGHRVRQAVAQAAGCEPDHVLVNCSHTHSAPPPPNMPKAGGSTRALRTEEEHYAESLIDLVASAARTAVAKLEPVHVGFARCNVELGVNRRQRVDGSETILGWNPDGACDRDVAVVRIDRHDGSALATLIAYACHPVVVGPDVLDLTSDFVGPLRARVRAWTGAECLFLQACSGNILPLEAFFDTPEPAHSFAERLALAALRARDLAEPVVREPCEAPYRSAVPIALWRLEAIAEQPETRLAVTEATVALPLLDPPTLEEIGAVRRQLERRVAQLKTEEAAREVWNPPDAHASWARAVEERILNGTVERSVEAPLQAIRIGGLGLAALPCEPFCELGIQIKERASAPFPVVLGYSNDLVGYVPTRDEYRYGGYEPSLSQRHFGNPSPFAPEAGELLVERSISLLDDLFSAS